MGLHKIGKDQKNPTGIKKKKIQKKFYISNKKQAIERSVSLRELQLFS